MTLYKVYQPIRAYNGQLQLEFVCDDNGLKYIVETGVVKECTCGKQNYVNTGNTLKDLLDMGFVVKADPEGYARF